MNRRVAQLCLCAEDSSLSNARRSGKLYQLTEGGISRSQQGGRRGSWAAASWPPHSSVRTRPSEGSVKALGGPSCTQEPPLTLQESHLSSEELLRVPDPCVPEISEPVLDLVQVSLAVLAAVTAADIHGAAGHLPLADHCGGEGPRHP